MKWLCSVLLALALPVFQPIPTTAPDDPPANTTVYRWSVNLEVLITASATVWPDAAVGAQVQEFRRVCEAHDTDLVVTIKRIRGAYTFSDSGSPAGLKKLAEFVSTRRSQRPLRAYFVKTLPGGWVGMQAMAIDDPVFVAPGGGVSTLAHVAGHACGLGHQMDEALRRTSWCCMEPAFNHSHLIDLWAVHWPQENWLCGWRSGMLVRGTPVTPTP